MGQLLVPALVGAGVGAVGGAATGKNPFKTALLGAGLGAGGAGLIGAGGTSAATAVGGADLAGGAVAPAILGTPTLNASLLTSPVIPSTFATPSVYGGGAASSLLDKTGAFLSNNIGNPFSDLTGRDKLSLGMSGFNTLNQPTPQMQVPSPQPITRGNPEAVSSPVFNTSPNVLPTQENKIGLTNLLSRMPLTEEEQMRLQQQLQTTGFRGR